MAVIRLIQIGGVAGQGGHADAVGPHAQGLHAEPGQLAEGQVGFRVADHGGGQRPHLGDVRRAQQLFGDGPQKLLLHLDAPDVAFGIAALYARVVLAEAHQLNGLFTVQMLHAGLQINVQVLGGVVPHHVVGHIEIHAADQVDQLFEPFKADHHIAVDGDAQQHLQLFFQLLRAAVKAAVDFFDLAFHIGHGVAGDIDHVHLLGGYVVGGHDDGVGARIALVGAAEHKCIIILFTLFIPFLYKGLHQVVKGVLLAVTLLDHRVRNAGRHIGRLGEHLHKSVHAAGQHQDHGRHDQRDVLGLQPLARPLAAGLFCRLSPRSGGRRAVFCTIGPPDLCGDGRRFVAHRLFLFAVAAKYLHFPVSFSANSWLSACCERGFGVLPWAFT